jgi:iron complex outermembrane receptor protein
MRSARSETKRIEAGWVLSARRSGLTPVLAALIAAGVCDNVHAAEADNSNGLAVHEVVVTAERRNARLVDTPISITALSGDQLVKAGVDNLLDLGPQVPALRMDKIGASVQPTIRGITSNTSGPGTAGNVAIYVDGSYIASQSADNFDLPDVSDIQVLKGPQGTLFGRNATGGAILVKTLQPTQETHAKFTAGLGSYNEYLANGYITGGLTDKLSGMLSGGYRKSDGYYKNIATGSKTDGQYNGYNVSGKLLYTADNNDSFLLTVVHSNVNDAVAQVYRVDPQYGPKSRVTFIPGAIVAETYGRDSMGYKPRSDSSFYRAGLNAKINVGDWATLTSYSSYFNEKFVEHSDLDGAPVAILDLRFTTLNENYSQEFDLASKSSGPLKWSTGVYYFHENASRPNQYINPLGKTAAQLVNASDAGVKTDAYAAFADGTYDITSALHLTVGFRYSIETKTLNAILPVAATAKHTWDGGTPRAVLRYDFDPNTNVYASFSEGFKSGAYNLSSAKSPPVSPENVKAYEVGFKHQEDRFQFSGSAYYYDYSNLQVTSYILLPGAVALSSVLQNAAQAQIYGADGEVTYRLTDNFTAHLNGAYTHGRYTAYTGAVGFTNNPNGISYINVPLDASGKKMIRTPEFTGDAGLNYEQKISYGTVRLGGNVSYSSSLYFDAPNQFEQKAFALLGLSAEWIAPDGKWSVLAVGRNVTNKHYVNYVDPISVAILDNDAPPATFRITASYRY